MLEPGFLKQIVSPRFIENDLIPDRKFQLRVFRGVGQPFHLPLQSPLHGAEAIDDAILHILNQGEYLFLFHAERLRISLLLRHGKFNLLSEPNP